MAGRCLIAIAVVSSQFASVRESADAFLALFPHRFDYLYANHPQPDERPGWKTESRHPLSDRLINQADFLFGVRFGKETQYVLLDIDVGSVYHPRQDAFAISRLQAALEPLGLVSAVTCTSSYSNGLHIYFPLDQVQNSWHLSMAIAILLEQSGFKLKPGQLELFPDPKPYDANGLPALFNGHRLPLQAGSYLVNSDFQPIWSDRPTFVQQWQFAQARNAVDSGYLQRILKAARRRYARLSVKANKFLNDLNAEIEIGWTGLGQTNRLLGRIAMRCYIFHHFLYGGEPLVGQPLVDAIVSTARSLPGYYDYCQHQHEIEQRSAEWARCAENSHYFPYGVQSRRSLKPKATSDDVLTWNQQRSQQTREKIRQAIAHLLDTHSLPAKATARFQALVQYGIGGGSLYRHRDLWHPRHVSALPDRSHGQVCNVTAPDVSDSQLSEVQVLNRQGAQGQVVQEQVPNEFSTDFVDESEHFDCKEANQPGSIYNDLNTPNLLAQIDGNALRHQGLGNSTATAARRDSNPLISRSVGSEMQRDQQLRQHRYLAEHRSRMQAYLASGDPILIAEARAWAEHHQCC